MSHCDRQQETDRYRTTPNQKTKAFRQHCVAQDVKKRKNRLTFEIKFTQKLKINNSEQMSASYNFGNLAPADNLFKY